MKQKSLSTAWKQTNFLPLLYANNILSLNTESDVTSKIKKLHALGFDPATMRLLRIAGATSGACQNLCDTIK
jgi:hypothetical protein